MSEIESQLKKENEIIKHIFDFNGDKTQIDIIKEIFINFIKNSENSLRFFLFFLNDYAIARPQLTHVSRELVYCIFICFPDNID